MPGNLIAAAVFGVRPRGRGGRVVNVSLSLTAAAR